MKKLLLVCVTLFAFTLSGCSQLDNESEIEKALNHMENIESYRMDITMYDLPIFGTMSVVFKIDGDMRYHSSPLFDEGTYSKIVEGKEYEYIQIDGVYTLSDVPEETDDQEATSYTEDLNPELFEKNDNDEWVYPETVYTNDEETEYMDNIIITLNDDGYIKTMTYTMYSDDMAIDCEIALSGYGSTTVELP